MYVYNSLYFSEDFLLEIFRGLFLGIQNWPQPTWAHNPKAFAAGKTDPGDGMVADLRDHSHWLVPMVITPI